MPLHIKRAGSWRTVKDLWIRRQGQWVRIRRAWQKINGNWTLRYQGEVVVLVTADAQQINVQNYFLPADWTNTLLGKRVRFSSGVRVWSYTTGVPAINCGTGRSGRLILDGSGGARVFGHGGERNSGDGGTAILAQQSNCWVINFDSIRGGGAGGGRGGQGGPGQEPYTYQEGPSLSGGGTTNGYYWYQRTDGSSVRANWGQNMGTASGTPGSLSAGGWTYFRGSFSSQGGGWAIYSIYRQQTRYNPTTGGLGGLGGRGQGLDASGAEVREDGQAGAPGGTLAGTGAFGGDGAQWGLAGATGLTGNAGNNGGGSVGQTGGLAGPYVQGIANVTLANNNEVLGRAA